MVKKLFMGCIIITILYCIYPNKEDISFPIMEGTKYETSIFINDSRKIGPTVFVIAGIHGNEIAGINACETLKSISFGRGKIIILSRANKIACDNNKRTMYFMQDLNRTFPGDAKGTDTEQLAGDIVKVVKRYQPTIIIDLHESAKHYSEGEYYLGNAVIFTPMDVSIEIVGDILENANENIGEDSKFTYFSGAPKGSINKEVSEQLRIPVITVETNMQLPLKVRENQHLNIISTILEYYGMDD